MKYGIYHAFWETEWGGDFIPYIGKVKRLGFDVLEVACLGFAGENEDFFRNLKAAAEDNGIVLTGGYGPDPAHDISSPDPGIVKAAFANYRDMFRKMDIAGIRLLGGGLYSHWPADFGRPVDKRGDRARSAANMRRLADMSADYGIVLGMEVLNRFEGYLINTCEEAVEFVSEVDRPNVQIMLDTFHMNIEEDSFAGAIKLAGGRLCHFHVGEANRRPPFEGGRIPWAEIGSALCDIGYDGAVVMEPFVQMGGRIGRDIRVWRNICNDCSEAGLDASAAASVRFLRGTFEAKGA